MSKVLDLARDFEQRSKQQAAAIESNLNSEFERHERAISEALRSSEQRTNDAIVAHSRKMGWMLLKSWGLALVGVLLLLSATSGMLWFQGKQIVENQQRIASQKKALSDLVGRTWGIELLEDKNGRFIVLPKGYQIQSGWTVGKRPALRLEKD